MTHMTNKMRVLLLALLAGLTCSTWLTPSAATLPPEERTGVVTLAAPANTEALLVAEFEGHDREAAKTSIAPTTQIENFDSLEDLLDDLPEDADMLNHHPPITRDQNSKRVAEERRNVRVKGWIYAAKLEDDMDFHL